MTDSLTSSLLKRDQLTAYIQRQQQALTHYRDRVLLTETEAALVLHVSKAFLRDHRHKGQPPIYYKLGNSVRYDYNDLLDYIEAGQQIVAPIPPLTPVTE